MKLFSKQIKRRKSNLLFSLILVGIIVCLPSVISAETVIKDVPTIAIDKTIVKDLKGQMIHFQFISAKDKSEFNASFKCQFCFFDWFKVKGKLIFKTDFSDVDFCYFINGRCLRLYGNGIEITNIS